MNNRVFVYFNLHKKLWSIKCLKTGLVIGHAHTVFIKDATFKVSKRGRERVITERVKNVHAGVVGTLIATDQPTVFSQNDATINVTYNPYKYETFVDRANLMPVLNSGLVYMDAKSVPIVTAK